MKPISITVKCYKKRPDGTMTLYFESNNTLNSGLFLYDVYTLTIEHYRELLSPSPNKFILEVLVECDRDYIKGRTIINSSL